NEMAIEIDTYHWKWDPYRSSQSAKPARNARAAAIGGKTVKPNAAPVPKATDSSDHRFAWESAMKTATAVARPRVNGPVTAIVRGRSGFLATAPIHRIADVFIACAPPILGGGAS